LGVFFLALGVFVFPPLWLGETRAGRRWPLPGTIPYSKKIKQPKTPPPPPWGKNPPFRVGVPKYPRGPQNYLPPSKKKFPLCLPKVGGGRGPRQPPGQPRGPGNLTFERGVLFPPPPPPGSMRGPNPPAPPPPNQPPGPPLGVFRGPRFPPPPQGWWNTRKTGVYGSPCPIPLWGNLCSPPPFCSAPALVSPLKNNFPPFCPPPFFFNAPVPFWVPRSRKGPLTNPRNPCCGPGLWYNKGPPRVGVGAPLGKGPPPVGGGGFFFFPPVPPGP